MRRIKAILLLCLVPISLWAAPAVTGVTGTVSNGGTITISGSGFGSGPSIAVFDDFEGGTVGARIHTTTHDGPSIAPVGSWSRRWDTNSNIFYGNEYAWSGSKAMVGRVGPTYNDGGPRVVSTFGSSSNKVFGIWWIYYPAAYGFPGEGDGRGYNWKQVWFQNNPNHMHNDLICMTVLNNANYITGNYCGELYDGHDSVGTQQLKGTWQRYTFYAEGSSVHAAAITRADKLNYNGTNVTTNFFNDTTWSNQENANEPYGSVEVGGYCHINTSDVAFFYDDVYITYGENARARVEIGNNATYTSCTNLAVCTPTSWSDTSITAVVRAGSFTTGTAYLFVVDSSGAVSSGKEITLGEESEPAPAPPTLSNVTISGGSFR